jgi:DegV family protein with EDD domain
MPYTVNGEERLFDLGRKTNFSEFYQELRDGAEAVTSTRSPSDIADFFREIVKDGMEVLYLSFSSALSGHHDLSLMARKMIMEEYPEARIEIVDTLRISMGAGELVMYAQQLKEEGKPLEEVRDWVLANRQRAHAWFSVDDLNYLKKGGRLSGAAAAIGTILDVKPILKLNTEGKIVAADKVKGSKKILKYFLNVIQENVEQPEQQTAYVLHADSMETAIRMKEAIEESFAFKEVKIQDIGPVIGCHTGPGAMAVIFMGREMAS